LIEHAFGNSKPFSVGVEEELLLVDPETLALEPSAARLLDTMAVPEGTASHEIYASGVELRSPPSASVGAACRALAELRGAAVRAGATLMGAGIHPTGAFGDAELVETERYRFVGESMRGLVQRTPECALHVHVGMPDERAAMRVFNGIRRHMPLLAALGANSPLWFGTDSGFASARFFLVRSFPRRAVPRAFHDFQDYVDTIERTVEAGQLEDYTFIWWDARLHPRLGTVELREIDAQSRLGDAAALSALVQSLCLFEHEQGTPDWPPPEAIAESAFRASRDGVDAHLLHDGAMRPVREIVRATLRAVAPHARSLGCEGELEGIERIVREGGGAGRQRAALARGGVQATLEQLVRETISAT
jgi:glutamate---cysteine ligase / carboxylate-amine ligase